MKKALIITTVSGFVPQFEMNNVRILQSMGYEVHYAANYHTPVYTDNNDRLNGSGMIWHQIDFVRSPYRIDKNLIAYSQLLSLMKRLSFDLVHCHTPMGGVLGRLAAKKTNTRHVIYTAHGFHFYKGAPVWNWLLFYPVECWLARYTDVLITINREDYIRAKKFHLKSKTSVHYVPGVGINIEEYQFNNSIQKDNNKLINLKKDYFILLTVGEISKGKNQELIIRSMAAQKRNQLIYLICGTGKEEKNLKKLVTHLQLDDVVLFLGYRTDVVELLNIADCFIFPSKREGLPVSVMEAMAVGLPVVCSKIRGNSDLIQNKKGGYCISGHKKLAYISAVNHLKKHPEMMRKMKSYNQKKILQYSSKIVKNQMRRIYTAVVGDENEG